MFYNPIFPISPVFYNPIFPVSPVFYSPIYRVSPVFFGLGMGANMYVASKKYGRPR